ncbi:GntR family transcriptional regulator [Ramlibacter sp.]|uniref:GntR family transcriptional regulator n=1 Tax=Ramlibacter sp. TaxID=1917967 RepID=UPI003D0C4B26
MELKKITGGSSLTHAAYEQLRDDVLSGAVRPGQKLKIHELIERLGANQGAVREALSRLASEGLVVSEPQKGFRACPISAAELKDLTRVRIEIESLCLRRAIELGDLRWESELLAAWHELSRTPEKAFADETQPASARMTESWSSVHSRFHAALIASCDSPWLLRLRAQLFAQAERYRRLSVPLQQSRRDTNEEHLRMMEAVIARDAQKACDMLAAHFNRTSEILLKALDLEASEPPSPAKAAAGAL